VIVMVVEAVRAAVVATEGVAETAAYQQQSTSRGSRGSSSASW